MIPCCGLLPVWVRSPPPRPHTHSPPTLYIWTMPIAFQLSAQRAALSQGLLFPVCFKGTGAKSSPFFSSTGRKPDLCRWEKTCVVLRLLPTMFFCVRFCIERSLCTQILPHSFTSSLRCGKEFIFWRGKKNCIFGTRSDDSELTVFFFHESKVSAVLFLHMFSSFSKMFLC